VEEGNVVSGEWLHASLHVAELGGDTFRVARVHGEERISDLYSLWIDVVTDDEALDLEERALGHDATLTLRVEDRERAFSGLVARVELVGHRDTQRRAGTQYRLELVPRAFLMTLRRTSRVFQDLRVDEILREVLAPYFIPARFALHQSYPKQRYTTQLEETDFAFVQRLSAEYGLFFFFEEAGGLSAFGIDLLQEITCALGPAADLFRRAQPREVIVFGDTPLAYGRAMRGSDPVEAALAAPPIPSLAGFAPPEAPGLLGIGPTSAAPVLRCRTTHMAGTDEMVLLDLVRRRSIESASVVFGDYDPRKPRPIFRHHHAAGADEGPWSQARKAFCEEGGALADFSVDRALEALSPAARGLAALVMEQRPLELYAHHNRSLFPDPQHDRGEAARILSAARRSADLATGTTICPWLSAGHVFRLEDHVIDRLNREWAVVGVRHALRSEGDSGASSYSNEITCVPADVTYPAVAPPPRRVSVCYTATVTGTEPIHTAPAGTIEVRFHWDRENERAGLRSTCWLRVMQPWAGNGWGTQFLPRVGTEVVVTFEGGDPDKPIVLGGIHNAHNPPPFPLPEQRTKSGVKTRTVSGDGANELSFDDQQGAEKIFLYAQRDYEIDVQHDRVTTIRNEDRGHVLGDRNRRVDGVTHEEYVGLRETVARGGEAATVHGQRGIATEGDESTRVSGTQRVQVDGSAVHSHRGRYQLVAESDVVQRVRGNFVRLVGSEDGKRSYTTKVEGDVRMSSSETLELSSEQGIVLRCGKSVLRLSPDQAQLSSPSVVLAAKGVRACLEDRAFRVLADGVVQLKANKLLLQGELAGLGLSTEAILNGVTIHLNSPQSVTDAVEALASEPTVIVLTDQDDEPIPNHEFRIVRDDGREVAGCTDENGRAELDLSEGGDIAFPGLRSLQPG
jgi:uncharacterized protein involved in type VI secretion and phage assembly